MIPNNVRAAMTAKAATIILREMRAGIDPLDIDPVEVAEEIIQIALDETSATAVECGDAAHEAACRALNRHHR